MSKGGLGLITVLGHPRVLADAATDPQRRHVVTGPGGVEGVSAYEPLYGPHAEGSIALRPPHGEALALRLLDGICRAAADAELVAVRFVVLPAQVALAELLAAELRDAELDRGHLTVGCTPSSCPGEPRSGSRVGPRWGGPVASLS